MHITDAKAGMKCTYRTESVLCCIEMRPALKIKFTLEQSHFRALPPEAFVSVNIISFCVMTQQNKSRVGLTESHLAKSSNNHICVQNVNCGEWSSSAHTHFSARLKHCLCSIDLIIRLLELILRSCSSRAHF